MRIGHLLLDPGNGASKRHLTALVRAMSRLGIEQHALVGDETLARELNSIDGVSTGPLVRTPIMAYCLMPDVDIGHMHDMAAAQAGLLLTLTRSVPYIVTQRLGSASGSNAILRSAVKRARCIVCQSEHDRIFFRSRFPQSLVEVIERIDDNLDDNRAAAGRISIPAEESAARYSRLYDQMTDSDRRPALML